MCLWAHRSFCCLAASVGIHCLPLQFSEKFSKLLHALTLTFQSTNTTSYLPGKAEIRKVPHIRKPEQKKHFLPYYHKQQPQITLHCILWSVMNSTEKLKGLCEVLSHQTEVINTTGFKSAFSHPPDLNSLKKTIPVIHPSLNLSALAAV